MQQLLNICFPFFAVLPVQMEMVKILLYSGLLFGLMPRYTHRAELRFQSLDICSGKLQHLNKHASALNNNLELIKRNGPRYFRAIQEWDSKFSEPFNVCEDVVSRREALNL